MPKSSVELSVKDIMRFFLQNATRFETLLSNNLYASDLWESLFTLRFGEPPTPGPGECSRIKRGSTDPRWDEFLHRERAFKIVMRLRMFWLRRSGR
jgi:hypothetical protein